MCNTLYIYNLQEIQLIAPKQSHPNDSSNSVLTTNTNAHSVHHINQQALSKTVIMSSILLETGLQY